MASVVSRISASSLQRWAAGGWVLFIGENLVLSENRSWLIEELGGDESYHMLYGTLSTIACTSIGYGYFKLARNAGIVSTIPQMRVASLAAYSLGLGMVSQIIPKLQIPVMFSQETKPVTKEAGSSWQLQMRCPFDFADKKMRDESEAIMGVDRITTHPGLWSFGIMGLGQAFLATNMPLRIWWSMPLLVAAIGGSHADSRFRRGMGGQMSDEVNSKSGNIPFLSMVLGRQGPMAFVDMANEIKGLNAMVGVGVAVLLVGTQRRSPRAIVNAAVRK
mmetsp:Transcript_5865/g.8977  ORF Transcript_5865/g.8977 Transcript_5865/m.8977 type:complete len:276 (-) Transcript_5865:69-896(-)|eukprot:CAMPEP_0118673294 /NCGR_PEP_ID=MMETSP0800-20121206/239_1 /TAXON_ID=210618 ORGANISM="Striatella unipunctata, Strain CCMP2910" /NCGR_SAMPLE_ID=MMETSP0800 /ASSEMBLY_ACC=CAM_ASM_000638 /LENGTH=275 /DNA_ID=CAMNT_0006568335 /DNA_START=51 /DNA_END=878 /DNA_ORIENTATION=+